MTTAKRLTALEQAAERAKAARLAVNERLFDRIFSALPQADLEVLHDLAHASPEREVEVWEAGRPYFLSRPEEFPVIGWAIRTNEAPEDAPILPAPAGSVAQLEAWTADCDRTREELEEPTTAVVTALRWGAALWRWWAALAREVGEQP